MIRKSQNQTGGGVLTPAEKRIVDSVLYADIVTKLGISAFGSAPRFDSDSASTETPAAPTTRLQNVIDIQNTQSSFGNIHEETLMTSSSLNFSMFFELNESLDNAVPSTSFANIPQGNLSTGNVGNLDSSSHQSNVSAVSTSSSTTPTGQQTLQIARKRNMKDIQIENSMQLTEHLNQQKENNLLQKKYIEIQIERSQIAKEREILQKRLLEIEIEKSVALKNIEIEKQKQLADMEIEMKRRKYNE